jgi:hypothetical protein
MTHQALNHKISDKPTPGYQCSYPLGNAICDSLHILNAVLMFDEFEQNHFPLQIANEVHYDLGAIVNEL